MYLKPHFFRVNMTAAILAFLCFAGAVRGADEIELVKNGDFSEGKSDWTFLRSTYDAEKKAVVFPAGDTTYSQLRQVIPIDLPAGNPIRVEGELMVSDPKDVLKLHKGHPQLLLSFESEDGKRIFYENESGRAAALKNTNGEFATFSASYRVPAGAVRAVVMVKTGVPLEIIVRRIRVLAQKPVIPVADGTFPFLIRGVKQDSVANYSFLNHCPAGSLGFLKNIDGEFVFPNGEKIRWFGINLVASRVFDHKTHAEADDFAESSAGLGINIVRIHHLTPEWQRQSPFYEDREKSTLIFHDAAMEKLDYLLAALKKNGIYVTNEIVDASLLPAPDETPYGKLDSLHSLKLLMMFDPDVQTYVKKWVKRFYCRKNRYTGIPLIEDPQLAVIGITNEISVAYHNGGLKRYLPPRAQEILKTKFSEYLAKHNLPAEEFDIELKSKNSVRFWDALLRESFAMWRDYVRELGYRGLVSGSNFGENFFHHGSSTGMDFMDAHLYWGFAGWMDGVDAKTRYLSDDRWSELIKPPRNEGAYTKELFARFAMSSTPDMPLISSEHRSSITNFTRSAFRAVGLPFFSTIHAFQGWDGFYIFASQGANTERIGHRLDIKYDTTYLATFPISSFLLRGGVISPARKSVLITLTEEDVFGSPRGLPFLNDGMFFYPEQHKLQVLYPWKQTDKTKFDQVHSLQNVKNMNFPAEQPPVIAADTNEFYRNWKEGFFVINTAKVQGAEGFFDQTGKFDLKDFKLNVESPFGVFFLSAGKEPSLADGDRILFLAVGECFNSGDAAFGKANGWSLPGTPPVLVKPVKGTVTSNKNRYDIWALGESGERRTKVQTDADHFDFDTGRDRTVWYEFVRTK